MRVGLCVGVKGDPKIGRLREFIEHYINLGFDKIFLYDNNEEDGPNPLDVLQDYLEYIEYNDIRGNHDKNRQWGSYTDCYYKHNLDYDWILFADDDEYLILKEDKNIKEYLSRDIFKDADCIHVNWKIFNSGDILFEDPNISLIEQYTTFIPTTLCNYPNIPEDNHVKTIVKCCGKKIYFRHPHFASCIGSPLKCVTASGNPCVPEHPFSPFDESLAVLNHYQARAVDVFCYKRLGGRSTKMFDDYPYIPEKEIERYFKYNERTPERENYIAKFLESN
jgi:hypothetical protein